MILEATDITLDCPHNARDPPGRALKMATKRYRTKDSAKNPNGLTLLFAHCIGSHKEQWEPMIERIFDLQCPHIYEAWAFDWQTHGDSAVLNRELLESAPSRAYGVSAYEWSEAIAAFVQSPQMAGRRIVPIGHSGGAGTMSGVFITRNSSQPDVLHGVLTTRDQPLNALRYLSLILIEPTIIPPELFYKQLDERVSTMEFVVSVTLSRREEWKSREDAYTWMSRRVPWESWDPRVLRKLTDYGLDNTPKGTVVIKGDRRQEALSYPDVQPHFNAATELGRVSETIPVHFIWSADKDNALVPHFVQNALTDGTDGRKAASVTRVKGGHMLVQEQPDALAEAICAILDTVVRADAQKSRL